MFVFRSTVPARVDLCVSSEHPSVSAGFLVFHSISQGLFFGLELFIFFSGSAQVLELQSKLFSICCRYFLPGLSLRCCVMIFLIEDFPAAGFYSSRRSNLFCAAAQVESVLVCAQERAVSCGESSAPLNFSARLLGFGQSDASVGSRFNLRLWPVLGQ
jgi:hypothetical protein